MTVFLEGNSMVSREAAHEHLAKALNLPDYYGRNLDALYDLVMEISEETEIVVLDSVLVVSFLGAYGQSLLSTLREAVDNNPNLIMILM